MPLSFWHVLSFFDHFPCSHLVQDVSVSSCFHVPALKSVISPRSPSSFYWRMYLESRSGCRSVASLFLGPLSEQSSDIYIFRHMYLHLNLHPFLSVSRSVYKILWVHTGISDSSLTPQSSFYFPLFHICDSFLWQRNLAPIILNIFT